MRLSRPLGGGCVGIGPGGWLSNRTSAPVFPAPRLLTLTPSARRVLIQERLTFIVSSTLATLWARSTALPVARLCEK